MQLDRLVIVVQDVDLSTYYKYMLYILILVECTIQYNHEIPAKKILDLC